MGYLPQEIEKKWQEYWAKNQTFFTDLTNKSQPKKYILAMFPYPSGSGLHVGHIRNYTITDALARFYRLNGYSVLMPIGWDAFGLPAEQYAIQTGNHPATFTNANIQKFKEQLLKMGFSYDWSKEINTSDPDYYQWTQWIFKQIYCEGLAEYKEIPVYWCEKLGTVLANEEIKLVSGQKVSERGGYPVVQKSIPQWVLKITNYAEKLLNDLSQVDWPNSIKSLQINWIGLSFGTLIDFALVASSQKITVFTTRPDTIYGVAVVTLSVSHPLISEITLSEYQQKVKDFCDYWKEKKENKEIMGEFTGSYCLNPLTEEKIPIWVTNFVISDYGTGAVMIAPFFCEEKEYSQTAPLFFTQSESKQNKEIDFTFVQKYRLSPSLNQSWRRKNGVLKTWKIGVMYKNFGCINCGGEEWPKDADGKWKFVDCGTGYCMCKKPIYPLFKINTNKNVAIKIITEELEKKQIGNRIKTYHLRDWIFSRQRYWGEPIPIIHWENGEKEIISDEQLPLKLPPLTDFTPSPLYYSPLQKISEWVNVKNSAGKLGTRDVNVMPQWAGSCWYYIAFLLKKNNTYLALNSSEAQEIIQRWLPVDIYIGGQEHANLHLLYARFWHKVLAKIGIVFQPEPFQKLLCQGMILGADGEKMSKSRGNVINPNELIEKYGVDALRLYEVFLGPPEQTTNFDPDGVRAMKKWLDRVYNFSVDYQEAILTDVPNQEIEIAYQEMVSKTTEYYQNIKLNLVVSALMTFINKCYKVEMKCMPTDCFSGFLQILNPLAPHLSEEMWSYFQENSLARSNWPRVKDSPITTSQQINMVVQVNGQKKTVISVDKNKNQDEIEVIVKNDDKVKKIVGEKKIIKIIFIKGKLINLVID